jgi:hypothetical protein
VSGVEKGLGVEGDRGSEKGVLRHAWLPRIWSVFLKAWEILGQEDFWSSLQGTKYLPPMAPARTSISFWQNNNTAWELGAVAHAYNPSYLGG